MRRANDARRGKPLIWRDLHWSGMRLPAATLANHEHAKYIRCTLPVGEIRPFSDERAQVIQRLVADATSAELVLDQEGAESA